MKIGEKIRRMRMRLGLTQEELANRCELSKGFISQLERDLTSPSIATLIDILESLGTDLKTFFNDTDQEKIVFSKDDFFEKHSEGTSIVWLVPNSQKNAMEPILYTLQPGAESEEDNPHEGEEFGYVLSGRITLVLGDNAYKCGKGESFYFKPTMPHFIRNHGKQKAELLWVSNPPSF
ncbi:MAG: helix-turn-helix transcriptional regulator [Eubacteriales bacterium]|nr:helix-turn-helix transcriptional regulator [Eubacteriales bacterium]